MVAAGSPVTTAQVVLFAIAALSVFCSSHAAGVGAPKGRPQYTNETNCPTTNSELAQRIDLCAKPLMDLIEGRIKRWPKTEDDIVDLCQSIAMIERCMKDLTRRCARGLQKTILSTLANSIGRSNKRECSSGKLVAFLRLTQCVERNQRDVRTLVANAANRFYFTDEKVNDLDQKTNNLCCIIAETEESIKSTLSVKCLEETKIILRLYRSVVEDLTELVCHKPKCKDIFDGNLVPNRINPNSSASSGLVQVVLLILFSLG